MSGLANMWTVASRRKWLILATMAAAMSLAVGINCFVEPTYRACSKAIVSGTHVGNRVWAGMDFLSGATAGVVPTNSQRPVEEILAVSGKYIGEMAWKLQLRDANGNLMDIEKIGRDGIFSTMKKRLSPEPAVRIRQREGTEIIEIVATSADARRSMVIANTLAEVIVEKQRGEINERLGEAKGFLAQQIAKAKEDFKADSRRIVHLRNRYESVDIDAEAMLAAEKMKSLLEQKEDAITALAQAKARLNLVNTELDRQSREFLSPDAMRANPYIEDLKKQLTALRVALAGNAAELTAAHPRVASLKDQIAAAEAELEKEISVYRMSAPERAELERHIAALEARLEMIHSSIDDHEKTLGALSDRSIAQAGLDMDLKAVPKYYSSLLDSLHRLNVMEAGSFSAARIVEPAKTPLAPVFPNKTLNCILGMFLGLTGGLGLAFLKERSDDTIRSAEDVRMLSPALLVGTVPRLKRETALIAGLDPNDPLYESYRWIRRQIALAGRGRNGPWRTLLVTSAGPGEGKSTTAINLGIAMAREGKNVVLVDADLRRPSLARYFGIANEQGLAECLRQTVSLDVAVQRTHVSNLTLIPSGRPFADPGALFETIGMKSLVEKLQSRYDAVILDSAPLLVKTDALALAGVAYGSVIVLESERTTRHEVFEMVDLLSRARHADPLVFVLNKYRVKKGKGGYARYCYAGQETRQLLPHHEMFPKKPCEKEAAL